MGSFQSLQEKHLRLLPFKHLLNSTFYRRICLTEGNAKEKLESKVASSILGCIKSVNAEEKSECYSALARSHSGHSGKSSVKGHKYDEGSGAPHV